MYSLQSFVTDEPVAKNFSINNMVMEERMRQGQPPPWHEEDEIDSTRVSTHSSRNSLHKVQSRFPAVV